MGAWGTAVSSNDTFKDIYSTFFDLYNDGQEVGDISIKLIADNQETIEDEHDANNFWFALAKAQWECKLLDKLLFEKVSQIIKNGQDLEIWRQLGASNPDIKKRQLALEKFLADLKSERPQAKQRKKKIIRQPVFRKGDCLTFKLQNGNYGGALVLEEIRDTAFGHNLIATTKINQAELPSVGDFEKAEIIVYTQNNRPGIHWFNPIRYKKSAHLIHNICNIDVAIDYRAELYKYGHMADFDLWVIQQADRELTAESLQEMPALKLTVKELTKRKKWKLF